VTSAERPDASAKIDPVAFERRSGQNPEQYKEGIVEGGGGKFDIVQDGEGNYRLVDKQGVPVDE
jgi:hypothetical protein